MNFRVLKSIAWALIFSMVFEQFAYADVIKPIKLGLFDSHKISLRLPPAMGVLEEIHRAEDDDPKLIYLLKEAHTNESAERNIAGILDQILQQDKTTKTFYVEAATGNVSLSDLRRLGTESSRRGVAESYIRKGLFHGAELLDLTSERAFGLVGVEDPDLYQKALSSYRAVAENRSKYLDYLKRIEVTTDYLKTRLWNPSLIVFEESVRKAKKKESSFTDYLDLLRKTANAQSVGLSGYPGLTLLGQLREKESQIDFTLAQSEEKKAVASLPLEDQQKLKDWTRNLKAPGKVLISSHEDETRGFFALLKEKLGTSVRAYPELSKYFDYLDLCEKLDSKQALEEIEALQTHLFEALTHTEDEKQLLRACQASETLRELFQLTLLPERYQQYKEGSKNYSIKELTGFLNLKLMDLKGDPARALFLEDGYDKISAEAENFYALTSERDKAFIRNMFSQMDAKGEKSAALVAGGYHSENLKAILRAQGVSYAEISPRVYHETNLKKYEKVLLGAGTFRPVMAAKPAMMGVPYAAVNGMPNGGTVKDAVAGELREPLSAKSGLVLRSPKGEVGARLAGSMDFTRAVLVSLQSSSPLVRGIWWVLDHETGVDKALVLLANRDNNGAFEDFVVKLHDRISDLMPRMIKDAELDGDWIESGMDLIGPPRTRARRPVHWKVITRDAHEDTQLTDDFKERMRGARSGARLAKSVASAESNKLAASRLKANGFNAQDVRLILTGLDTAFGRFDLSFLDKEATNKLYLQIVNLFFKVSLVGILRFQFLNFFIKYYYPELHSEFNANKYLVIQTNIFKIIYFVERYILKTILEKRPPNLGPGRITGIRQALSKIKNKNIVGLVVSAGQLSAQDSPQPGWSGLFAVKDESAFITSNELNEDMDKLGFHLVSTGMVDDILRPPVNLAIDGMDFAVAMFLIPLAVQGGKVYGADSSRAFFQNWTAIARSEAEDAGLREQIEKKIAVSLEKIHGARLAGMNSTTRLMNTQVKTAAEVAEHLGKYAMAAGRKGNTVYVRGVSRQEAQVWKRMMAVEAMKNGYEFQNDVRTVSTVFDYGLRSGESQELMRQLRNIQVFLGENFSGRLFQSWVDSSQNFVIDASGARLSTDDAELKPMIERLTDEKGRFSYKGKVFNVGIEYARKSVMLWPPLENISASRPWLIVQWNAANIAWVNPESGEAILRVQWAKTDDRGRFNFDKHLVSLGVGYASRPLRLMRLDSQPWLEGASKTYAVYDGKRRIATFDSKTYQIQMQPDARISTRKAETRKLSDVLTEHYSGQGEWIRTIVHLSEGKKLVIRRQSARIVSEGVVEYEASIDLFRRFHQPIRLGSTKYPVNWRESKNDGMLSLSDIEIPNTGRISEYAPQISEWLRLRTGARLSVETMIQHERAWMTLVVAWRNKRLDKFPDRRLLDTLLLSDPDRANLSVKNRALIGQYLKIHSEAISDKEFEKSTAFGITLSSPNGVTIHVQSQKDNPTVVSDVREVRYLAEGDQKATGVNDVLRIVTGTGAFFIFSDGRTVADRLAPQKKEALSPREAALERIASDLSKIALQAEPYFGRSQLEELAQQIHQNIKGRSDLINDLADASRLQSDFYIEADPEMRKKLYDISARLVRVASGDLSSEEERLSRRTIVTTLAIGAVAGSAAVIGWPYLQRVFKSTSPETPRKRRTGSNVGARLAISASPTEKIIARENRWMEAVAAFRSGDTPKKWKNFPRREMFDATDIHRDNQPASEEVLSKNRPFRIAHTSEGVAIHIQSKEDPIVVENIMEIGYMPAPDTNRDGSYHDLLRITTLDRTYYLSYDGSEIEGVAPKKTRKEPVVPSLEVQMAQARWKMSLAEAFRQRQTLDYPFMSLVDFVRLTAEDLGALREGVNTAVSEDEKIKVLKESLSPSLDLKKYELLILLSYLEFFFDSAINDRTPFVFLPGSPFTVRVRSSAALLTEANVSSLKFVSGIEMKKPGALSALRIQTGQDGYWLFSDGSKTPFSPEELTAPQSPSLSVKKILGRLSSYKNDALWLAGVLKDFILRSSRDRKKAADAGVEMGKSEVMFYYFLMRSIGLSADSAAGIGLDRLVWLWMQHVRVGDAVLDAYGNNLTVEQLKDIHQQLQRGQAQLDFDDPAFKSEMLNALPAPMLAPGDTRNRLDIMNGYWSQQEKIISGMSLGPAQKNLLRDILAHASASLFNSYILEREAGVFPSTEQYESVLDAKTEFHILLDLVDIFGAEKSRSRKDSLKKAFKAWLKFEQAVDDLLDIKDDFGNQPNIFLSTAKEFYPEEFSILEQTFGDINSQKSASIPRLAPKTWRDIRKTSLGYIWNSREELPISAGFFAVGNVLKYVKTVSSSGRGSSDGPRSTGARLAGTIPREPVFYDDAPATTRPFTPTFDANRLMDWRIQKLLQWAERAWPADDRDNKRSMEMIIDLLIQRLFRVLKHKMRDTNSTDPEIEKSADRRVYAITTFNKAYSLLRSERDEIEEYYGAGTGRRMNSRTFLNGKRHVFEFYLRAIKHLKYFPKVVTIEHMQRLLDAPLDLPSGEAIPGGIRGYFQEALTVSTIRDFGDGVLRMRLAADYWSRKPIYNLSAVTDIIYPFVEVHDPEEASQVIRAFIEKLRQESGDAYTIRGPLVERKYLLRKLETIYANFELTGTQAPGARLAFDYRHYLEVEDNVRNFSPLFLKTIKQELDLLDLKQISPRNFKERLLTISLNELKRIIKAPPTGQGIQIKIEKPVGAEKIARDILFGYEVHGDEVVINVWSNWPPSTLLKKINGGIEPWMYLGAIKKIVETHARIGVDYSRYLETSLYPDRFNPLILDALKEVINGPGEAEKLEWLMSAAGDQLEGLLKDTPLNQSTEIPIPNVEGEAYFSGNRSIKYSKDSRGIGEFGIELKGAFGVPFNKINKLQPWMFLEAIARHDEWQSMRNTPTAPYGARLASTNGSPRSVDIFWINPIPEEKRVKAFTLDNFRAAEHVLQSHIKRTPLVRLEGVSERLGKTVLLKADSEQLGGSFKTRGVTYEVIRAIERVLESPERDRILDRGLKIVTQSTGNHGIAMINAVTRAVRTLLQRYSNDPEMINRIRRIEPVVFTLKGAPQVKLRGMKEALAEYRQLVKASQHGNVIDGYEDYAGALSAREDYMAKYAGHVLYMDHGGDDIMLGHGSAGLEIADQLEKMDIGPEKRVIILVPVGAGGPIGIGAALKTARPNTAFVMVQAKYLDAFVRSMKSGKLEKNNLAKAWQNFRHGTAERRFIYADGIAVDGPESLKTVKVAKGFVDAGVVVNAQRALDRSSAMLFSDLRHSPEITEPKIGGTTALTLEALLTHVKIPQIRDADVVVLFATEGNIDSDLVDHAKKGATLAERRENALSQDVADLLRDGAALAFADRNDLGTEPPYVQYREFLAAALKGKNLYPVYDAVRGHERQPIIAKVTLSEAFEKILEIQGAASGARLAQAKALSAEEVVADLNAYVASHNKGPEDIQVIVRTRLLEDADRLTSLFHDKQVNVSRGKWGPEYIIGTTLGLLGEDVGMQKKIIEGFLLGSPMSLTFQSNGFHTGKYVIKVLPEPSSSSVAISDASGVRLALLRSDPPSFEGQAAAETEFFHDLGPTLRVGFQGELPLMKKDMTNVRIFSVAKDERDSLVVINMETGEQYTYDVSSQALTKLREVERHKLAQATDITEEALKLHEANGAPVFTSAEPTAKIVLVDGFPDLPNNAFYQNLILRFSQALAKGSQVIFVSEEEGKAERIASLAVTLGVKNRAQFVAMKKEGLTQLKLPTSYVLADSYLDKAKALYGEAQKYFRLESPKEDDLIGVYAFAPIGALMDLVSLEDWGHAAQLYSQIAGKNVNVNDLQTALRGALLIPLVSKLIGRLVAQVYMAERAFGSSA